MAIDTDLAHQNERVVQAANFGWIWARECAEESFTDFVLGLVAADDCHDLLRVILAHLGGAPTLSLRIRRYSGDQQNGNKYLHVY